MLDKVITASSFMYRLFILLLLAMPVIAYGGEGKWFTVTAIANGKSFTLDSGDMVRLASIEVPNIQEPSTPGHYGRPGEPKGEEAKQMLGSLIMGRKIRIDYNPGRRDRHNRFLGQVYDEKNVWIQGEMLKRGFAEAYIFNDDSHELIEKMLAAEKEAQKAKRGLWSDPYYRIIAPEEAGEFINRYKLVEGRVVSVHEYHENTYINFSEH